MAQPESDDSGVDAGVEEAHRGCVAQRVHGDMFAGESGANCGGFGEVDGETSLHRVSGQCMSVWVREQRLARAGSPFFEIGLQHRCCG